MNKLPIALAGLLTLGTLPAQAGIVVLPNLFAKEYCSFRESGFGKQDAIKAALSAASIEGEEVRITRPDGSTTSADTVRAARAIADRCPEYL